LRWSIHSGDSDTFFYLLRAVAWRLCLDDPHRLPLAAAFGASVIGDALGNVTPLGALISEPSKVAFVRRRLGAGTAISAVAIENLFYAASVFISSHVAPALCSSRADIPTGERLELMRATRSHLLCDLDR